MTHSTALLMDTFAFLCFLHADDVLPMGTRYLPNSMLLKINAQLLVLDDVQTVRLNGKGGTHGTTECKTNRIRFLHYLCEVAGLIALTGRYLKPTPRAARWLTRSREARAQELFAAFRATTRANTELWRAYRLPGFRLDAPTHLLAPLLEILTRTPRDEMICVHALWQKIPFTTFEETPADILRGILRYLEWFGVIQWRGDATFHLTDFGAQLLGGCAAPRAPERRMQPLILSHCHGEFFVTASPSADWQTLYELCEFADLETAAPERRYRLDRARILRALQRGAPREHIQNFLEHATREPLPAALVRALDTWTQDYGRLTLRREIILEAQSDEITRLAARKSFRACLARKLSPRAVAVRVESVPRLLRHLEKRRHTPRVEIPLDYSTKRPSDHATIFHLYLAARLGRLLPDFIPASYRVPYSVVLDLEKQLSESDRALAAQMVDELTNDLGRRTKDIEQLPASSGQQPTLSHALSEAEGAGEGSAAETIERAIAAHTPLEIVYYTAARDATTVRIVEPLRIEWRNRVPYLMAFCRTRMDERVFRVDRIVEIKTTPLRKTPLPAPRAARQSPRSFSPRPRPRNKSARYPLWAR